MLQGAARSSVATVACSFHALRPARESLHCQSKRKQLGLLRHRWKHEISPLLAQAGRGSVAPRITLDNWHRVEKNIGVAKSWDKKNIYNNNNNNNNNVESNN